MPLVIQCIWIPFMLTALLWAYVKLVTSHTGFINWTRAAEDIMGSAIVEIEAALITLVIWVVYFGVFAFVK